MIPVGRMLSVTCPVSPLHVQVNRTPCESRAQAEGRPVGRDQDGMAASNSDIEALSPKVLLTCA